MMSFFKNKKRKKLLPIVILAVIFLQFTAPGIATAQTTNSQPSWISQLFVELGTAAAVFGSSPTTATKIALNAVSSSAGSAALDIVSLVNQLFGFVGGIVIYLGSVLISTAFSLNNYLMGLPIVQSGWQITRDITNLGFVLAVIIIAFATILRINQYGVQKMLPRLIAAAILVNFSLTIGGAILDFTNVITKFFIDRSIGNGSFAQSVDIGTNLTAAFNPQKLLEVNAQNAQSIPAGMTTALVSAASTFFVAAFTLLMGLVLLAIALMLLTRFVWLAFLLAVAPMPWLFGVIPIAGLSSMSKKWWDKFMHWAFVAPILSFFLYLTLATAAKVGSIAQSIISQNASATNNPTLISGFILQTVNMLILVGFLVGGLIAANGMGIIGAGAVYGLAKSAGNKAKGFAKNKTLGVGKRLATAGSKGDKEGKSVFERLSEGRLGKAPLLGGALRGLAGASLSAKEKSQGDIDNSYKNNKKFSKDTLANKYNGQKLINERDLGGLLALAEKGGWSKLDDATKSRAVSAIKRTGSAAKFAAYDPSIAIAAGMPAEKAVKLVEDVSKLDKDTVKQAAQHMRVQQDRDIGNKGTMEQRQAHAEGLKLAFVTKNRSESQVNSVFGDIEQEMNTLDKNIKDYKDAKDLGKTDEMERLKTERKNIEQRISFAEDELVNGGDIEQEDEVRALDQEIVKAQGEERIKKIAERTNKISSIKDKRRDVLQRRKSLMKQAAWQGVPEYKNKHVNTDSAANEETI